MKGIDDLRNKKIIHSLLYYQKYKKRTKWEQSSEGWVSYGDLKTIFKNDIFKITEKKEKDIQTYMNKKAYKHLNNQFIEKRTKRSSGTITFIDKTQKKKVEEVSKEKDKDFKWSAYRIKRDKQTWTNLYVNYYERGLIDYFSPSNYNRSLEKYETEEFKKIYEEFFHPEYNNIFDMKVNFEKFTEDLKYNQKDLIYIFLKDKKYFRHFKQNLMEEFLRSFGKTVRDNSIKPNNRGELGYELFVAFMKTASVYHQNLSRNRYQIWNTKRDIELIDPANLEIIEQYWRDSVSDEIYKKILKEALIYYKKGRAGDVEHIKWLYNTVPKFLKNTKLDPEIVIPVVLLHDVGYARMPKNFNTFSLNIRKAHMKEGANIAEEILTKINYPQEKIKEIKILISKHDNWAFGDSFEDEPVLRFFNNFDFMWMASEEGFNIVRKLLKSSPEKFYKQIEKFQKKNISEGREWYNIEIEEYYEYLMKTLERKLKKMEEIRNEEGRLYAQ